MARGLRGVSSLRRKLSRMPKDIQKDAAKGVMDGAERLRYEMLKQVPRDDGDLAASIEIKKGSRGLSAEVGPGARTKKAQRLAGWRARFTEFGTQPSKKRPWATQPHPFVFPAFKAALNDIRRLIDRGVDKALVKASRR